jgi:uncharacterized cupin superfamily protein
VLPESIGRGRGVTHFDEAPTREFTLGHLGGRWTMLGKAAGSIDVGLQRMQLAAGQWSTPAHEHGREEEIFYVLAGRGISWQAGNTTEVGAGDCVLYLPSHGAHTMHAIEDLDLLAFGTRRHDEAVRFPRLNFSLVGGRAIRSEPATINGAPFQFVRESELGPPELPAEAGARPSSVVNVSAVEPDRLERPRVVRTRRNLGRAVGSLRSGLQHVEVAAGKESTALHCHSAEEEIFVILEGDGFLLLGEDEVPVHAGHVVSRPPATGIAHVFRAGNSGLTLLAYGTREPNDICYYPRSNKISFRGVGVIARLERLDYWDGEDYPSS